MAAGRHVAFLRGINVGKAKRIAMADLRKTVEGLGYTDVRTLLNSGNVVFTVPRGAKGDPAARIEKAISTELGVVSRVAVLSAAELAKVVEENTLLDVANDPSRLLAAILTSASDRTSAEPLLEEDWSPDAMALGTRSAYLWCSAGILESRLLAKFGRALKENATTRNWSTILKLHAMANET
jgi:uncharacterized protein (DUF1697 family)